MESNMDAVIENMEVEVNQLYDTLENVKAENRHLHGEKILLEKDIEKRKMFHRKYVEDVAAAEAMRLKDHQREKKELTDENKQLIKVNRQLVKDVEFYKKAHEELAKSESSMGQTGHSFQSNINTPQLTTSTTESQTVLKGPKQKQKSSTNVTKINASLFEENKKLQNKLSDLSSKNTLLNKKIKQLERFQNKIENKKSKFCRDSDELERLVDLSEKKNKDMYTPEVLMMLGNLAKHKK